MNTIPSEKDSVAVGAGSPDSQPQQVDMYWPPRPIKGSAGKVAGWPDLSPQQVDMYSAPVSKASTPQLPQRRRLTTAKIEPMVCAAAWVEFQSSLEPLPSR